MGIFTGIGMVTPDASKYKKAVRSLERTRARMMLEDAQNKIAFREKEDPREQSALMHSMWGRGLGKSSIFAQDKERLQMIQDQRMQMLQEGLTYAQIYQRMIKKKHHWEKVNQYYEMIDGIIGLAAGASGTSSGSSQDVSGAAYGAYFGNYGGQSAAYNSGIGASSGGTFGASMGNYYY